MNTNLANVTKLELSSQLQVPKLSRSQRLAPATGSLVLLLIVELCLFSFRAHAVLPEPDNVLFGTIALDGRPITTGDFDVVIEARRTPTGPAISSYQMGSQLRLGNFYSLRIPLESLTPRTDTNTTLTGDVVYIVIHDINGERETRTVTVGARGTLLRLDIGTAVPDSDGDGLLDAWELTKFGNLNNGANSDADGDGISNESEYIAGTDPNNSDDSFKLFITQSGASQVVSFFARRAEGPGYENFSRFYALEYSTNVSTAPWLAVPNQTNILGNNATWTYPTAEPDRNATYRGRVWLQRP